MRENLTETVIAAAMDVHRNLGPALLKSAYEECLCRELSLRNVPFVRRRPLPLTYKGVKLECSYTTDVIVESDLLLEIKAVEKIEPIHESQLLTYLRLSGCKIGLLLNFNVPVLKEGIRRRVWSYPEASSGNSAAALLEESNRNNDFSYEVIGAAIEVRRTLGPGLLESSYEECLCHELSLRTISFARQRPLPISYKGIQLDCGYRLDVVVGSKLLLEIKSVEQLDPIHDAQLLTYLRLGKYESGLLLNFNVPLLRDGIRRRVLKYPDKLFASSAPLR